MPQGESHHEKVQDNGMGIGMAVIKRSTRPRLTSEDRAGKRSTLKPTWLLVGFTSSRLLKLQFLAGSWPKPPVGSLLHGPLQYAACFSKACGQETKKENLFTDGSHDVS